MLSGYILLKIYSNGHLLTVGILSRLAGLLDTQTKYFSFWTGPVSRYSSYSDFDSDLSFIFHGQGLSKLFIDWKYILSEINYAVSMKMQFYGIFIFRSSFPSPNFVII